MIDLVNLTPHPLHIYATGTPDNVEPGSVSPVVILEPSTDYEPARLGHEVIWSETEYHRVGVPVDYVRFGGRAINLPPPAISRRYVVSLVVGLAATDRGDLLVLGDYVRDLNGAVIGCRKLARPCHKPWEA